jgi:hypothetical protein
MRKTDTADRREAIRRGLEFIYETARDPENFEGYGHDYLCCFHCIASTSRDAGLRRRAREMGQERAREWRRKHRTTPADSDAETIANLVLGSDAADRLGVRDGRLKQRLRQAAGDFTARDYFWFDTTTEPPPEDMPADCRCGAHNPRGRKTCRECKRSLTMMSRYALWLDALTRSYVAKRYGVRLGAPYEDVIKWLPAMRPYPEYEDGQSDDFYWAVYAVTHIVYTLNSYSLYNLSPRWLPDEFRFLKANLKQAIVMRDPETMGEFLDSLKGFGLKDGHPLIRKGVDYLLSNQNADGSWGDVDAEDIYQRYHPTWTAVDGLRDYRWRGERLSFQSLQPWLTRLARRKAPVEKA